MTYVDVELVAADVRVVRSMIKIHNSEPPQVRGTRQATLASLLET